MPSRATETDDHVCVIGAGPAGLAVAAALHQVGIPVVVLERGTGPPSSGTALGLWTNAWRALDALHAAEELRVQYRQVNLVQLCREDGRLLRAFDLHSCEGGPHEFRGVRRSSLVAALAARLPPATIRYGHAVTAVNGEEGGPGVAVTVAGEGSDAGAPMRFAGVVGADGSASVAARAAGRKPARPVGQTAVRGVARFPAACDMPCDSIRQVWSVGPRAGMYPLTDTELYWFVCYDTPSSTAQASESGPALAREEALRAVAGWGWGVEAAVHATRDAELARNTLGDRWDVWPGAGARCALPLTLAGDALHPMTPNLGQGACTALEDGVELAQGLVRAGFRDAASREERVRRFREAARAYEAQRRRRTLPLTLRSNLFGKVLQAPSGVVAAARDVFVSRAFQPAHFLSHANYDWPLTLRQLGRATLAAAATSVSVRLSVQRDVGYGRSVRLVGAGPLLGDWKPEQGVDLAWTDGNVWTAELAMEPGTALEFKFVSVAGSDIDWESGLNHVVLAPEAAAAAVSLKWGAAEAMVGRAKVSGPAASSHAPGGDEAPLRARWSGKETVFMQGNEHSQERVGRWETEGLEGAALEIVGGDRDAGSWLQKLGVAEKLLVQSAPRLRPGLDAVAAAYVYLQWVGNGTLACAESGGHHRPNRHAELARSMFRSLEWVIAEGTTGPETQGLAVLARRLQARLPSFDAAYTASTPLTRIRDIAHRNDIPHELKQEIKHTIQNKLHRNAGPEDLVATEAMLQRITRRPGEHSDAFVAEFRKFHAELSDFFSAGSLTDSLAALAPTLADDPSETQIVDRFLEAKRRLEAAGPDADSNCIVDALHALGTLRALLCSRLASGLRSDVGDGVLAARQRWRQAEMQAEDYAFVLLSRFSNLLDSQGGAEALVQGKDGGWALPIGSLVLGLRQVGLGTGRGLAQECAALEQELSTWQRLGGLKASLQRLRRLTHDFSQILMDGLSERAKKLGDALGVPSEISSVFTEAEIRASIVFQLSKLAATLLKGTELVAGGSPFDVVVGGEALGKLREVDTLQPGCAGNEACVLVVKSATGDEEVGALGPNLKGIILRHDIPHLSHLGVRARQERVPFVLVEDDRFFEESIAPLLGIDVILISAPDATTLKADGAASSHPAAPPSPDSPCARSAWEGGPPRRITVLSVSAAVVPLAEAEAATCGSKATACSQLSRLASASKESAESEFAAPQGVVLPFGTMELALEAGGQGKAYREVLVMLDGLVQEPEDEARNARLARLCAEVQALILNGSKLPKEIVGALQAALPADSPVIARSSANVEDLAGLSGAGLYDSIPGLDPGSAESLQRGVALVWASLFSRRAVLSRGAVGIPSSAAAMAVLLQRQLSPDLSFVLHTVHPITRDVQVMWAEVAPGQGEILATGSRGAAWRMEVAKDGGALRMLAFANFSTAWLPGPRPRKGGVPALAQATVDYSTQALSGSEEARVQLSRRLLAVGAALEAEQGGAQDIEGCVAAGQLYVVQTRPQP